MAEGPRRSPSMHASPRRPSLRPVETIVVPDPTHGRLLVLRDTHGVSGSHVSIPPPLMPIVARFTGERTCAEIAREVSGEQGEVVPVELVEKVARELDEALFLEGDMFEAALARLRREFHDAPVRAASHAGGAYSGDPVALRGYLDERCLARAASAPKSSASRSLRGLIAPHIDPWRGAVGYGHAYAALRDGLAPEADTFFLFGTSHALMAEPFALCRKGFDTPLGAMQADLDAIDRIAARTPYDPYTDELNHLREHSIEFQVVFLRHVLGKRPARIVPILAGLGRHQARKSDPGGDRRAMALLDAVAEQVDALGLRAFVIAGADLAHVGPRFGDRAPLTAPERERLRAADEESVMLATSGDATGFWKQVTGDLDSRRVCGLAPIYAALRALGPSVTGAPLHYEQTVDEEDGSIVSHAAAALHA